MSQVIAGIYEIEKEIGSGGGGIVYLGRHLRLEKPVVLKADKRTLSTGMEALRREVDMLKDLSHTYIPQVYDFVQEDGVVYTVMDFIEGESLDKLLERKQACEQSQVIQWACQLLEALSYLHGRPPHGILHGDIKPANIMLRLNGDVCLIDYNIALALGEEGAVKVGFSRGYASPEHYGKEYISNNRQAAVGRVSYVKNREQTADSDKTLTLEDPEKTLVLDNPDKTLVLGDKTELGRGVPASKSSAQSSTTGRHAIMLDVRSDIYSLGATLYHMLAGHRPAEDALEVEPLGADVCSPSVAAIIQKAMSPDPGARYQSAEEMRTAFLQLYKNDIRAIRYKRHIAFSAIVLTLLFLVGGACSFVGLNQLEQLQRALALAEYSANALAGGDVPGAVRQAMEAIPSGKSILEAPVTAEAQKALTDALGVYDLADGFKSLNMIELPSAPFKIAASPEGTKFAVVYAYEVAVYDMETQHRIVALPIQNSALSDALFVDETHIVYAGDQGVAAYDLDAKEIVWIGENATTLTVSADCTAIAAVNRDEDRAIIYRASDGAKLVERSFNGLHMAVAANDVFADPERDIFALNEDGSMLAVSFYNGGLVILDLQDPDKDIIIYEESNCYRFEGEFHSKYFAFVAEQGGKSSFGLIDTEEITYLGEYESQDAIYLKTDKQGIYLASGSLLVSLDPETFEEKELAYADNVSINAFSVGEKYVLLATDDNGFSFYDSGANLSSKENSSENSDFVLLTNMYAILGNRTETSLRVLKLENHSESQLLAYDARYDHDEARISGDGLTAMLFSYRGFRIYDMDGVVLSEAELPDANNVYDQQFRKSGEGSWLEVIWYDGTVRRYSAKDGSMISEEVGEPPSKDLFEEFYTDKYRIESSLHGAPEVYDLQSDKFVAALEEDAYLTYVTQVEEYIITEYISAEGERYGILLDADLQKLAYFPRLCDVAGDILVFDYESGDLRQCRLYSLQELTALGETYIK